MIRFIQAERIYEAVTSMTRLTEALPTS